MLQAPYRAVIFDLDGTLLDTLEEIRAGVNHALSKAGFPTHPLAAYRHFVGDGVEILLRRATPPAFSSRLPTADKPGEPEALAVFQALLHDVAAYHEHNKSGLARPFAEIPDLVAALTAAGIKVAVLSNKPQPRVVSAIPHFFPDIPFFRIQGATPEYPLKPDPAAALAVAAAGGFAPEEVVYLGDSDVDMFTAKRAGMFAAGAGWGFRGEAELRAAGAGRVFSHPLEVLELWPGI